MKNLRFVLVALMALVISVNFSSCKKAAEPKDVVSKWWDALIKKDVDKAFTYLYFEELNIDFTEYMNGPNAIMFGKDILDSIKALSNFAKQNDKLEIRIGIISGDVATLDTIKAYAAIPSRDGLLTMFASGLIQYVKEFAIGLNMIAEQKEEK